MKRLSNIFFSISDIKAKQTDTFISEAYKIIFQKLKLKNTSLYKPMKSASLKQIYIYFFFAVSYSQFCEQRNFILFEVCFNISSNKKHKWEKQKEQFFILIPIKYICKLLYFWNLSGKSFTEKWPTKQP